MPTSRGMFGAERSALQAIPAPQTPFSLLGMLRGAGTGILDLMELGQTATRPEDIPPSAALAVPAVGGALGAALAPRVSVGIFGGRLAKQAPAHRELAEAGLKAGAPPKDVLKATRWFRGADGKMRFEIDDSQARFTADIVDPLEKAKTSGAGFVRLGDAFAHPDLFKQYPSLSGLTLSLRTDKRLKAPHGSFDPSMGTIVLNVSGRTPAQIKSTLLHEVQHAVQEIEEFARGGSPEEIAKMLRARGRNDLAKDIDKSFEGYRRLAGEVEARATQAREGMTAAERLRSFPVQPPTAPLTDIPGPHAFLSEDMPRQMQVVIDQAGNVRRAVSAANPAPAALPGIVGTTPQRNRASDRTLGDILSDAGGA